MPRSPKNAVRAAANVRAAATHIAPWTPVDTGPRAGPAAEFRYSGALGSVGFITPHDPQWIKDLPPVVHDE